MPSNAPDESIRLSIGGLAHDQWDGWSVESDLLTAADGFELELYTKDVTRLPAVLVEGAPCSLTLGRDRVLTGQVDEFEHDISRQGIFMRINGRDRAAPLVDCSAPFVSMRVHAAALRGVVRKDAVAATGAVILKGAEGVELLAGAELKHTVTGELFSAKSSVKIGADGTAILLL